MLELFMVDRGHPYHFREKDLHRLFARYGLEEILVKRRGFSLSTEVFSPQESFHGLYGQLSLSWADKVLFVLRSAK
jgi:hypothetical protein